MKIVPIAIIRPPANKEKINSRGRWRRVIDVLERAVVGQHPIEIGPPGFSAREKTNRRRFSKIASSVRAMPNAHRQNNHKQINWAFDIKINIKNAVGGQNNERWNDRQDVTYAHVNKK